LNSRDLPALGTLREHVELQRKDQSIDSAGGHVAVFTPLAIVWARVIPASGALVSLGDAKSARISHNVTVRFRSDLNPGDRIIYRSSQLEIISANDLNGRRAYLICKCSQIETTG